MAGLKPNRITLHASPSYLEILGGNRRRSLRRPVHEGGAPLDDLFDHRREATRVHRRIRDKGWNDSVMAGRGLGIWIAVFYVMPIILAIEGALQPRAAWQTVGQSRLLWIGVFVGGPTLSMVSGSALPALGTVAASFVFMAKLRSPLLIAGGMERERRRRPPEIGR